MTECLSSTLVRLSLLDAAAWPLERGKDSPRRGRGVRSLKPYSKSGHGRNPTEFLTRPDVDAEPSILGD